MWFGDKWPKVVCCACVVFSLSSCSLVNQKKGGGSDSAEPIKPYVAGPAEPAAPAVTDSLLSKAEALFQQGRLLAPEADNAYIRYRAVLMLDPNSAQAKSGLDAILIHELDGIRKEIEKSRFTSAGRHLASLSKLFPRSPMLDSMRSELAKQRALYGKTVERAKPKEINDGRLYLDTKALSVKSQQLIEELRVLAQGLEQTDQGVMIYARSDSEGRWIYGQMREATPNYRIRGDIRIGRPAIKLLDPF